MNLTNREILVFGLVVLIVLFGGLFLVVWYGSLQGIGFGGMGPGMMGGFNMFGWLLPCLIPLGLLVLLVGGLVWLLVSVSRPQQSTSSITDANCPNCNRTIQTDWQVCPHCGTPLQKEPSQ